MDCTILLPLTSPSYLSISAVGTSHVFSLFFIIQLIIVVFLFFFFYHQSRHFGVFYIDICFLLSSHLTIGRTNQLKIRRHVACKYVPYQHHHDYHGIFPLRLLSYCSVYLIEARDPDLGLIEAFNRYFSIFTLF